MSAKNTILLVCLLAVAVVAVTVVLWGPATPKTGRPRSTPAAPTADATKTVKPALALHPKPAVPKPTSEASPVSTPEATPAADVESLRTAIFGDDADLRSAALDKLGGLLAKRLGGEILSELIASDAAALRDLALPLMDKLPEDAKIVYILQSQEVQDAAFRLKMLAQARTVVSSDLNLLLTQAFKDSEPGVQAEAGDIFLLFEKDKELYGAAAEGLASDNETIREYALNYFEENPTVRSVSSLIDALKSQYPDVVARAGDVLRKTTGAKIATNGSEEWIAWWRENGTKWGKEHAGKPTPTPASAQP